MTVDTSPSKVIILDTVACCTEHQAEVIVIRHLLMNRESTRHLQRRRHWSTQQPLYRSHDCATRSSYRSITSIPAVAKWQDSLAWLLDRSSGQRTASFSEPLGNLPYEVRHVFTCGGSHVITRGNQFADSDDFRSLNYGKVSVLFTVVVLATATVGMNLLAQSTIAGQASQRRR